MTGHGEDRYSFWNVKKLPGRLITFEGTEGAGKSTLIAELETRLAAQGHACVRTREPGGHPLAERIREILLSSAMDSWTELFLYEAARAEHLAQVILPGLEAGKTVLCDRFTDSTLAYQGAGRGLPWDAIDQLNTVATRGIRPDLTVWLDIDPAAGLQSAREITRFEREGVEFQTRVRSGFLKAMRRDPKRWLRIGARSGTPQELAEQVLKAIEKRLAPAARKPKSKARTAKGQRRVRR